MKQLPDKFSVYAKTLEEAKYITEKQKELCGGKILPEEGYNYRFLINDPFDKWGRSKRSYIKELTGFNITQEFTFEEFKSYFEEQTIPDFKVKGTKLPLINEDIQFKVENWKSFKTKPSDYEICENLFSFGYKVINGETLILAEEINYKFSHYWMFKEEDLIRLYKKQNNIEDMENKQIIGYKLVKPEYETYFNRLTNTSNIDRIKDSVGKLTWVDEAIKICKKAGVLDLWFEPVMAETERTLTLSNRKSVKITKEGVEAEGKLIKIKYIENLFCNTNTFGDTGWTIRYNSFDIGCYRNLKREDLSKIIETYSLIK